MPLVAGMEIGVKLGILRTIATARIAALEKPQIDHCLNRLQKCFDKRHAFAHAVPVKGLTPNQIGLRAFKFDKGTLPEARYFETHQIVGYARELRYRASELDAEFTRLGFGPLKPYELAELAPQPDLETAPDQGTN